MLTDLGRSGRDGPTLGLGLGPQRADPLQTVLLGALDDLRHRPDRFQRPRADAGLPRQHDRVRAIQDGVGAVAGLRSRGSRVLDHRLQNLRRHDRRLRSPTADLDRALLHDRDLLQRHLNTQVAAGHHHSVEGVDDRPQIGNRLRLFDFRDHRDEPVLLAHDLVGPVDVGGFAHEGHGDQVRTQAQCEPQVVFVLLGQGGDTDGDAGQVDALVVGADAAFNNGRHDVLTRDRHSPQLDLAVVDQQPVTDADIARQTFERRRHDVLGAIDVPRGDREGVAVLQLHRTVGEPAGADLRTLQVAQDAHGPTRLVGGITDRDVSLLVIRVLTVRQIQSRDVQTGLHQLEGSFRPISGRTEGGHNFGASHVLNPSEP